MTLPHHVRFAIFQAWHERCVWCAEPLFFRNAQLDHLVPRSLSGLALRAELAAHGLDTEFDLESIYNLAPSCGRCNREKSATPPPSAPRITLLLKRARELAPEIEAFAERARSRQVLERALAIVAAASAADDALMHAAEEVVRDLDQHDRTRPFNIALHEGLAVEGPFGNRVVSTTSEARSTATGRTDPRALPRAPLRFVNRVTELKTLDSIVHASANVVGPTIVLVSGMHGVGKSAVARQWANVARDLFEGDLFIDFAGRRRGRVVSISDALRDLLSDLGYAEDAIPTSLADRQRLFQRVTAGRRMLLLLDDVDTAGQVLAAVPAGAGSLVLATSTVAIEELLFEGAYLVEVSPLSEEQALLLLRTFVGADRVLNEPTSARDLVEMCGGLPIALCVVAGRLVARPEQTLAALAAGIAGLDALDPFSGQGDFDLHAVFEFAYNELSTDARTLYRRLGTHPGQTWDAFAAQSLAGAEFRAEETLAELVGSHLLEQAGSRFAFHTLVRRHALITADRASESSSGALDRLTAWIVSAVQAADYAIVDTRLRLGPRTVTDFLLPRFLTPSDAFEWFGIERHNVMAVMRRARSDGNEEAVWRIAEALWPLCASHKRFDEWLESQTLGAEAGRHLGRFDVEARMESQLARAYAELGDFPKAFERLLVARAAIARVDHPALEASIAEFTGVCRLHAGQFDVALRDFAEARLGFKAVGNDRGCAIQDYYVAGALLGLGRPQQVLAAIQDAYPVFERLGDVINVGRALNRQAQALLALGQLADARVVLAHSLSVLEDAGVQFDQAAAHELLADIALKSDDNRRVKIHRMEAQRLLAQLGHPRADELRDLLTRAVG